MTKDKHEGLHDTTVKQINYNNIKDQVREIIATYLTTDWPEGDDLSPVEVFNAIKEGVMEEAHWYDKHKNRCNDLCSLLFGHKPINLG